MAKKVLIVDDDRLIRIVINARMKKLGYETSEAADGKQALERVAAEKPDLIIMDVMMPLPNGYTICRQLKDDPECREIPIILLTGRDSDSDKFWGEEAGADAYITKNYDPGELLGKVKELIEK